AGAKGTVYYISNTASPVAQKAVSGGNNDFIGITKTSVGGAIAVGTHANIWQYGGTSGSQKLAIYAPGFNAENFMDVNEGYTAGDFGTIRRTDDGGATWQVVLPKINPTGVPNYQTVWTTSIGNAIVAGT